MTIGQTSIVEHLQQHVEHVVMRLLDFIEQDHAVRTAPHRFGEITAFLVTDISRRRADQTAHGMFFHELAHVDADHRFGRIEQEFRERLAQLRLADAGRAKKQERTVRPIRIGQPRTRTANRIRHRAHRFVLADDALMQRIFHAQQFLAFAFEHLADRNSGPARDDFGDFFRRHALLQQRESFRFGFLRGMQLFFQLWNFPILDFRDFRQVAVTLRSFYFRACLLDLLLDLRCALHRGFFGFPHFIQVRKLPVELCDVRFEIGQALLRFLVLLFLQCLALNLELDQTAFQTIQFFRLGIDFHADARRGFVHQVDGFVRQLPIGDVAIRQRCRCDDRGISDLHTVMHGVTFLQSAQDRDRVFHARLADEHFLEAAFERGVLLDVFAVFVERRRADAMQLAARERGLEHVAGIHRTFGLSRADDRMQFVDEEDDVALLFREILEHRFQTLLEFAAEFRTGDQCAHVERKHATIAQTFRHLMIDDALRKAFDDCCLAHAGFADQHWIIFRAALQNLDHAADFFVASDHRIEFGFFRAFASDRSCIFPAPGAGLLHFRIALFLRHAFFRSPASMFALLAPAAFNACPTSPLSSSAASTNKFAGDETHRHAGWRVCR